MVFCLLFCIFAATCETSQYKMMKKSWCRDVMSWMLIAAMMLGLSMNVASCSSDDDEEPQRERTEEPDDSEESENKTGATILITAMFAPGQLGDKGYADGVMEGIVLTEEIAHYFFSDSVDVNFISPLDQDDAKRSIVKWVEDYENPYYDCTYERRLLVLTEPFMTGLIPLIQDKLRPTDELLFLKLDEEDIDQIAQMFSLGNRVHGINIAPTVPALNFCKYISRWKEVNKTPPGIRYQIPVYRLYEEKSYPYRDKIIETMQEKLGDDFEFVHISLSGEENAGIYLENSSYSIVEAAFTAAKKAEQYYQMNLTFGCPYVVVDLGAGNTGWDYFLMGQTYKPSDIWTLMLDAKDSPRLMRDHINREFGLALEDWAWDWMHLPPGEMDRQITYSNEYYYDTSIIDLDAEQ